MMVVHR